MRELYCYGLNKVKIQKQNIKCVLLAFQKNMWMNSSERSRLNVDLNIFDVSRCTTEPTTIILQFWICLLIKLISIIYSTNTLNEVGTQLDSYPCGMKM